MRNKNRVIAYVDGFNLYFGMKKKWSNRYLWLDLVRLSESLLKDSQELEAVKYFTSRVSQRPGNWGKWKRQNTYLEALEAIGDVTFYYGHYIDKSVSCRRCGANWYGAEEKKTDVSIAVELLCDAHDDRFDTAIVISGDSDLSPPIKAVIARHPNKRVIVAFPPGRHSNELSAVSTSAFPIRESRFRKSRLPLEISKRDGNILRCPNRWRN